MENLYDELLLRANKDKLLAFVHTYGCQGNEADSDKIRGQLKQIGFDFTDDKKQADLILFNTCAVRENAENHVFGNVGELKRIKSDNPNLIIVLCGCMTSQKSIQEKIKESYPFVDICFGTSFVNDFKSILTEYINGHGRLFKEDTKDCDFDDTVPIYRTREARALVTIMYGCNNFCTYCIVPFVRGRERSRSLDSILAEIKELVLAGYKEIMLLGQNVNSYKDESKNADFAYLLREIDKIEGDYVVRFMSSHPKDLNLEIIDIIADSAHLSHSIHLPFQSGSNEILRKMARVYSIEDYMKIIDYAKSKISDVTFTSDIIVAFPSESETDFNKTLEVVKNVEFIQLFTFIYSKRSGTKASEYEDNLEQKTKQDRMANLLSLQESIAKKLGESYINSTQRVLFDSFDNKNLTLTGRSLTNLKVTIKAENDNLLYNFADVKITENKLLNLYGELL